MHRHAEEAVSPQALDEPVIRFDFKKGFGQRGKIHKAAQGPQGQDESIVHGLIQDKIPRIPARLGAALTGFLTKALNRTVFGAASDRFVLSVSARITVPGISKVPILGAFFTKIYPFELIIIVIAVIAWYFLYRTRFGLRLRACGDNPAAVDAAGGDVAKTRFIAVMVSGALSGLAGMCFAYSILANFSSSIYMGYGYLAIAGYIFGNWEILPSLGACLIFGLARSAGSEIVLALGMPAAYSDLVMTLPYVVTLLLLVFLSRHNQAPSALGQVYDKSQR